MESAVYEELEEVKAELEQVKEEYRNKTLMHQDLKRAYDDRMIEFQEAKLRIDKLSEDICVKSAEVCEVQRICEDLKSRVAEKDLILRQVRTANENLRAVSDEKVKLLEGSNRELVTALDDVMEKEKVLEDKLCARNEENECLKARLLATERKCFEIEKKVCMSKEGNGKDEVIARLEDEFRNVQEQLKWKNEQFDHLEEAHEKLHGEFRLSKLEWEKERLVLIETISSLQSSLDSQTRISITLQTKLNICNQALAREESRRKLIEIRLTESKALFENVNVKWQEEQTKTDQLTTQRDEEIANLRGQMATKDIMLKEMEFKILDLEQQKEDMHGSLREFQEAGIKHAGSVTSMTKHQEKLRNLKMVHGNCSVKLDIKEAEWASQRERMEAEAEEYLSEIENKKVQINELHKELEMCQFSLQITNEEMAVVIMVLISEFSEAYSKLFCEHENIKNKEPSVPVLDSNVTDFVAQHQIHLLTNGLEFQKNMIEESQRKQRQLEEHVSEIERTKKADWEMFHFSLQILNEEMAVVTMLLKSEYSEAYSKLRCEYENKKYKESSVPVIDSKVTDLVEQHQIHLLTNDLEFHIYKNIIKESQRKQRQLEEHANEDEFVEKTHERKFINAELLKWKNEAGTLKLSLEEAQKRNQQITSLLDPQLENQQASKQEIYDLKSAVEELERNICVLQQHVTSLEADMAVKDDALKLLESKNKNYTGIIKELELKNMHLNEKISGLVMHRNSILLEMEGACNQLHEICCKGETLLGSFMNSEYAVRDYISNTYCCNKTSLEH